MLARVLENIYWLSRYVERAENTARLVSVNANLLLDVPNGYAPGWLPLIDISGGRSLFDQKYQTSSERNVVHFLIADPDNPGSIASSLKMARENARTLRDVLPTDAWEILNQFCLEFEEQLTGSLNKGMRFNFLKRIVLTLQMLAGVLDGTINRNEAYTFLMLARNLERADMTSRIVDVRAAHLLPAAKPELRPFEAIQWMSVLKSLSGYEMYRLAQRTRVARADVLRFLLGGEQFPRACLFCLKEVERCLRSLPRSSGVLDTLGGATRFLREANFVTLDQPSLHAHIDDLQLHISSVHSAIAHTYFPRPSGPLTQVQVQYSGREGNTLPLLF
jgi:uncharacterized alpha-E superfamily protein